MQDLQQPPRPAVRLDRVVHAGGCPRVGREPGGVGVHPGRAVPRPVARPHTDFSFHTAPPPSVQVAVRAIERVAVNPVAVNAEPGDCYENGEDDTTARHGYASPVSGVRRSGTRRATSRVAAAATRAISTGCPARIGKNGDAASVERVRADRDRLTRSPPDALTCRRDRRTFDRKSRLQEATRARSATREGWMRAGAPSRPSASEET